MKKNISFSLILLGVLLVSLALPNGTSLAQSEVPGQKPTPEGPPPAGLYPSNTEHIVTRSLSGSGFSPLTYCATLWWDAKTTITDGLFITYSTSTSISRDNTNHNIACDISTIGARARIWINGNLNDDSGMLEAYNSADKSARADGNDLTCGGAVYQAQGNHEFILNGVDSWYPITSVNC